MYLHATLGSAEIMQLIRQGKIKLGGNRKLKIYGTLSCKSGKRMKQENRVFFASENEALLNGFRPCGNCIQKAYQQWNYSAGKQTLP